MESAQLVPLAQCHLSLQQKKVPPSVAVGLLGLWAHNLLGLEHGTPFGTMGKGRGRCENGASLHVVVCEKLH